MRYEIDNENTIRVWVGSQEEPILLQPHYPNGTPWADSEDAELWAQMYVAYITDPNANPEPPISPVE